MEGTQSCFDDLYCTFVGKNYGEKQMTVSILCKGGACAKQDLFE